MTRVKGNVVRAWVNAAERSGLLSKVEARLSPATLAMMKHPPLAGSWVDAAPLTELFLSVLEVAGRGAALKLSSESMEQLVPFYSGMLSGVLRILGASPSLLFSRMNEFVKQTMQGIEYQWRAGSERTGVVEVRYPAGMKMTEPQYLTLVPTFELVFRLCKVKGVVSEPQLINDHSARFDVRW